MKTGYQNKFEGFNEASSQWEEAFFSNSYKCNINYVKELTEEICTISLMNDCSELLECKTHEAILSITFSSALNRQHLKAILTELWFREFIKWAAIKQKGIIGVVWYRSIHVYGYMYIK